MIYCNKRLIVDAQISMLQHFVNCFLKAFVEILDWQGLREFGWAFGGPSTKIWLIEGDPHMYLHVDSWNGSSTAS